MAIVLPFPTDDFIPPRVVSNREIARMAIQEWQRKKEPAEPFRSDVSGNPREFNCSPTLLDNIRMARDEREGRKLRGRNI